jgi:pyruvate,orthophosphate dikinase
MPGMMNTILNIGLNDASVEGLAKKTGNPRFAYDSYRRFVDMFGSTAMGVEHEHFEHEIHQMKHQKGVKLDTELTADDLKELVKRYKAVYKKDVKEDFRRNRASSSCLPSTPSSTRGTARKRSSIGALSASLA